ncbi:MAG: lipopolysaccharide heptosyltransferase II [Thermodesulfobacteriota bacterium]|nr:MAG: lipopolysaccharide heptosyltransferase II [Thermodesulfobacteriota bacterium]
MASGGEIKKILVRAPNWIGDAVMCTPALECLKSLHPASRITVLTKSRAVPVFENNPHASAIIEYDHQGAHSGLGGRLKLRGELKGEGFDLAVLFQNAFDAAFISFISGIPERVGYATDMRSGLLTKAIPVSAEIKKTHQTHYYTNIVTALGGVCATFVPKLYISKDEEDWADGFIRKNGLEGSVMVGAAPGASYGPAKRWPAERFAEALAQLSRSHGLVPLVFGGPEDTGTCREVARRMRGKYLDLSGRVTLRQFMALASRVSVFISNDSGPMHITAALGVPTVAIFGSTDPVLTGPLGADSRVVSNATECSPCFARTCRFKHYDCLSIGPDRVVEAALALLGASTGKGVV